jgi:hypothetical protein
MYSFTEPVSEKYIDIKFNRVLHSGRTARSTWPERRGAMYRFAAFIAAVAAVVLAVGDTLSGGH